MSDFAKEVWTTLSAINVNEHTEKKGRFTYLSWTWAWATLMEHYPESVYQFMPVMSFNDSIEIWISVEVKRGAKSIEHTMWLPVMDFKNNAVINPKARDINDTRMRCLVKCLGMFGLGHYIYAGESIPQQPDTISGNTVDMGKVAKAVNYFKSTIDLDEEENVTAEKVQSAWTRLSNDEQIEVNNGLKKFLLGKKQYNTIIKGYLLFDMDITGHE